MNAAIIIAGSKYMTIRAEGNTVHANGAAWEVRAKRLCVRDAPELDCTVGGARGQDAAIRTESYAAYTTRITGEG
jgi:hypothetical protein